MGRPRKIEQATLAAYWLYMGKSVEAAAAQACIGRSSLQRWMGRPEWPAIQRAAKARWLEDVAARAREALMVAMLETDADGKVKRVDGRLALATLERLQEELAPAPQAVELRAILAKLDPATLPDEVVNQLASGKNVLGTLLAMLGNGGPLAGYLPPGHDGEIIVDPDSVPEHRE